MRDNRGTRGTAVLYSVLADISSMYEQLLHMTPGTVDRTLWRPGRESLHVSVALKECKCQLLFQRKKGRPLTFATLG